MLIQDAINALEARRDNSYIYCPATVTEMLSLQFLDDEIKLVASSHMRPQLTREDLLSDGWHLYDVFGELLRP